MMRISVENPAEVVLGMSGWVYGDGALVLEEKHQRWLDQTILLARDPEDTLIIDEDGINVLTEYPGERLVLKNAAPPAVPWPASTNSSRCSWRRDGACDSRSGNPPLGTERR